MPTMRFNHMELTFARGTLEPAFRKEVADFYGDVFGWSAADVEVVGQNCLYLHVDEGQFILCAEVDNPIQSPSYDHLGLLLDTREEVDDILAKVKERGASDDRVRIREYEDLVMDRVTVHAFYVKYLLPIYFDVQCIEYKPGTGPEKRWQLTPTN
jgi:predicted enzyme related to lactoylglutathione lyase